jgi:hypothetical protein
VFLDIGDRFLANTEAGEVHEFLITDVQIEEIGECVLLCVDVNDSNVSRLPSREMFGLRELEYLIGEIEIIARKHPEDEFWIQTK